ncbi:MAG: hypothetical protein K0S60_436 [Evtepia sp.]|jgi:ferrous iron transport protein B|nr:hypothetical protein [Evtepia sp.]
MSIRIALAGNPNAGKTTLYNALTGSNQFVGNWPGVTVEKKEGRLKQNKDITVMDLPGIYSLSPYSPEEVITRNYLMTEQPDVILNIIDGTNLERNLYLTTQLLELGIPVVLAINMMDAVEKQGDRIDVTKLGERLGVEVVVMSALKGDGVAEAAEKAIEAAARGEKASARSCFNGAVEHALAHIEERLLHDMPEQKQRFYAIKLFERDPKVLEELRLSKEDREHIEYDIKLCEAELDDDAEAIIIGQRYQYIESIIDLCCTRRMKRGLSTSQKIDQVVTHRFLALPIFAAIMFLVYFISVTTVGGWVTGWANDGLFGNGYFLFGHGSEAYAEASESYDLAKMKADAFLNAAEQAGVKVDALRTGEATPAEQAEFLTEAAGIQKEVQLIGAEGKVVYQGEVDINDYFAAQGLSDPDPNTYGKWIPGLPVLLASGLEKANVAPWLQGLILNGMVAGVGAVLSFVPQMLVLFFFLAFLEACGYMSRIAFILDQVFRRFGLSGKSFIPMLVSTGCGVPGIMASRTIESPRDRRMTVMTTTFIPCSAKLPIIALIAGAFFGGAWWVAPSAYFMGIAAVMMSGVILKKTKMFAGEEAPFVMELPLYHMPTAKNLLNSVSERGWSFIKKAGTIILLASIFIWFTSNFGWVNGTFGMLEQNEIAFSVIAKVGGAISWLFTPLGFGNWQAAVATVLGLLAKEGVVSTMGVLYGMNDGGYHVLASALSVGAAYAFMAFNLLCAPCFAAMAAIRQEMNSARWFWFAIGYQSVFAYVVALMIYQFWKLASGGGVGPFTIAALIAALALLALLFRPGSDAKKKVQKEAERVLS